MDERDLSRAHWRKSTYSSGNGQCVEVAHLGPAIAVRDSTQPAGPKLILNLDEWQAFLADLKGDVELRSAAAPLTRAAPQRN